MLLTNANDSFRYGWSWNQTTHNHWAKGADGQWGVAGRDDANNGVVDDARPVPPFEPGKGDDVSLDHPNWPDWPNAWPLPAPYPDNPGLDPIEVEALRAADAAVNENDYARYDWSYPGKNHKHLNSWND